MSWFDWITDSIKDRRFLAVLGVFFVVAILMRRPSPPLELPEAAHNTVGDLPVFEQADDGYVSSVEPPPSYVSTDRVYVDGPVTPTRRRQYANTTMAFISYSGSLVSSDSFSF